MAAEIKVGIGADVKPLEKGLGAAGKAVEAFDDKVDKLTEHGGKAFDNFSKKAIQANKAVGVSFVGTSRVLQDAAFGPGAIANNLAGLGDDFKQLSLVAKESGQSIGKTLVQSLIGGGGLNLALSGVTLGLSLASFGMQAWTRAFGDNEKAVKSDKQATEDYIKSLSAVNQAQLKGSQNAQEELTTLNVLFRAYQNGNLPLKDRKEAYKQLQDQYPAYFGNLAFEETATKKTKDAYDKLTTSLLASARARAAIDLITAKASEKLVNEQKITDLTADQLKTNAGIATLTAKAQKGEISFSSAIEQQTALYDKRNQTAFEIQTLQKENAKLTLEQIELEKNVNVQLTKGADLYGKVGDKAEEVISKIKGFKPIESLDKAFGEGITKNLQSVPQKFKDLILLVNGQVASLGVDAPLLPGLDTSGLKNATKAFNAEIKPHLDQTLQIINDWNAAVVQILQQGAVNAFASLGDAIGNAIGSGQNVFEAAGASLLASIGDVLVQMGKLTIAAGVASTALFSALSNPLNPLSGPAAIAAGVALVAIGGAVKAFSGSIGKGGGGGGQSSFTPSVGSGFTPSAPGGNFGIPRQDVFIPSTVLKGNDIVISYNRTTALNGRTG